MHADMLERPLAVDDYVVYYSNIYQVLELLGRPELRGTKYCRVVLIDKSKTTKSVKKPSHEMCKIDKEDVLVWKIKRGY
jgi:hypothetical protein